MRGLEDNFQLINNKGTLNVSVFELHNQVLFRIEFPDNTPPLIIGRIHDALGKKFWSSIPEGRLEEATEIGPLIESYYRSKNS